MHKQDTNRYGHCYKNQATRCWVGCVARHNKECNSLLAGLLRLATPKATFLSSVKMCDTWGAPKSRAASSTAGVARPFPRARVERSKGRVDLKDALERFVRPDAKRSGVTSR